MSDVEFKEQEINRTNLIDLQMKTSVNSPKKTKTNGLLEIQNTLEETVLIENCENDLKLNCKTIYDVDTEPEDEESFSEDTNLNNTSCPDFRLHMSASFINQSVVSSKSILIPDTMADEELDEVTEENEKENMSQVENENLKNEDAIFGIKKSRFIINGKLVLLS